MDMFAALMNGIKYDLTVCHEKKTTEKQKSASEAKSQKLIISMVYMKNKTFSMYNFILNNIILKPTRYIVGIQEHEHIHEQSSNRQIKFLKSIKTVRLPGKKGHTSFHTTLFSQTQDKKYRKHRE